MVQGNDALAEFQSMTNVAAEITPAVPASAAIRSGKRSGVRPCKASKNTEQTINETATTNGLREAMHKMVVVAKYIRKCSFPQPSPVRGTQPVGSNVARTSAASPVAPNAPNNRLVINLVTISFRYWGLLLRTTKRQSASRLVRPSTFTELQARLVISNAVLCRAVGLQFGLQFADSSR